MLTALVLGLSQIVAQPAQAGSLASVELRGAEAVLHFDGPVQTVSTLVLEGPRRIAVDVAGATIAARGGTTMGASPLVAGVRRAQYTPRTARVVFDLNSAALVSSADVEPDGQSVRLRFEDADAARFSSAVTNGRVPLFAPGVGIGQGDADPSIVPTIDFARPPHRTHSITVPLPKSTAGVALPRIYGPNDGTRPLVVIDAGHGGHDPGAINKTNGQQEKAITLAIARAIRDELVATGRVRVALTREDDRFLVLQERYGIARRMNADLFISIHADSADSPDAQGATIYTLSEVASDREAARLAARENKADVLNGVNLGSQNSDVSSILIDLTQRETMNLSSDFAQLLQREAAPYVAFRPVSHRFASLMVLKAPDMPSVLFETGYISNDGDVAKLASRDGQRQIAKGVARAVNVHFARRLALR